MRNRRPQREYDDGLGAAIAGILAATGARQLDVAEQFGVVRLAGEPPEPWVVREGAPPVSLRDALEEPHRQLMVSLRAAMEGPRHRVVSEIYAAVWKPADAGEGGAPASASSEIHPRLEEQLERLGKGGHLRAAELTRMLSECGPDALAAGVRSRAEFMQRPGWSPKAPPRFISAMTSHANVRWVTQDVEDQARGIQRRIGRFCGALGTEIARSGELPLVQYFGRVEPDGRGGVLWQGRPFGEADPVSRERILGAVHRRAGDQVDRDFASLAQTHSRLVQAGDGEAGRFETALERCQAQWTGLREAAPDERVMVDTRELLEGLRIEAEHANGVVAALEAAGVSVPAPTEAPGGMAWGAPSGNAAPPVPAPPQAEPDQHVARELGPARGSGDLPYVIPASPAVPHQLGTQPPGLSPHTGGGGFVV